MRTSMSYPPWVWALALLTACPGRTEDAPSISPPTGAVLVSMTRDLTVSGIDEDDIVWTGATEAGAGRARFTATATAGKYVVTAASRDGARRARAEITVLDARPVGALALSQPPVEGGLSGRFGDVSFDVVPNGAGAVARFRAESSKALGVELIDAEHVVLRIEDVAIDGAGELTPEERDALASLVDDGFLSAIARIGLDAGCVGDVRDPRILAALLAPWQVVMKYFVPRRLEHVRALAEGSVCRHFTSPDAQLSDERPPPPLPILSNGRAIPAAFGFLPIDAAGALEVNTSAAALSTDVDVYGPGGSMCRGACGADCEPTNCGEPVDEWRCVVDAAGNNTGEKQRWLRYTCGEHPGCIEHDACFDQCKLVFGVGTVDSGLCMRGCDLQAASGYGAAQGIEWALGHGPFTHERSYDYRQDRPIRDEAECPVDLALTAIPGAGLAPHATVLQFTGVDDGDPNERCRIDPGDGSPAIVVEPCPPSGEVAHTYAVPSEMRYSRALYVATIHRVGADRRASAEVLASWRFTADPRAGVAPLDVTFGWDGFAGVTKRLTCTLDFGDGSPPRIIDDCANAATVAYVYQRSGVYNAQLTVRGEDRPVTKTLTIDVRPNDTPISCDAIRSVPSWRATASFSYASSGQNDRTIVHHAASGSLDAVLVPGDQGPGGIKFDGHTPGGLVSVDEYALQRPSNELSYRFTGNDVPVPAGTIGDSGSSIQLSFDLTHCRFNVHVQALVDVTMQVGDTTSPGRAWVMAFQTPWLPIPTSGPLVGGGAVAVHSEEWILTQPGPVDWYWIPSFELVRVLGEDGLGQAQVQWSIARGP